ncbi:hypothetical protein ZIOFF_053899 [Zingiber officinale]|uniref:ATP synthase subunit O, mitochondrial n=1 Tax=Zingiber officinale TaxID=94328 RepID=A0A8J5FJI1_ZINOF|nr:hypothetical protein ZIOFF_053899 [Zingiber officinale]
MAKGGPSPEAAWMERDEQRKGDGQHLTERGDDQHLTERGDERRRLGRLWLLAAPAVRLLGCGGVREAEQRRTKAPPSLLLCLEENSQKWSKTQISKMPSPRGLRTFAIQTQPTEAKVKVPLKLFGGSGNYATALFIASTKANALDKVEAEILDVVEASKRSPRFSKFIKDMSIPKKTRVKTVTEIFSEAGFSDVTKNFLAVLADNGRLAHIDRISKRFVELTMAQRGEVKVIVTTVIVSPLK